MLWTDFYTNNVDKWIRYTIIPKNIIYIALRGMRDVGREVGNVVGGTDHTPGECFVCFGVYMVLWYYGAWFIAYYGALWLCYIPLS